MRLASSPRMRGEVPERQRGDEGQRQTPSLQLPLIRLPAPSPRKTGRRVYGRTLAISYALTHLSGAVTAFPAS